MPEENTTAPEAGKPTGGSPPARTYSAEEVENIKREASDAAFRAADEKARRRAREEFGFSDPEEARNAKEALKKQEDEKRKAAEERGHYKELLEAEAKKAEERIAKERAEKDKARARLRDLAIREPLLRALAKDCVDPEAAVDLILSRGYVHLGDDDTTVELQNPATKLPLTGEDGRAMDFASFPGWFLAKHQFLMRPVTTGGAGGGDSRAPDGKPFDWDKVIKDLAANPIKATPEVLAAVDRQDEAAVRKLLNL